MNKRELIAEYYTSAKLLVKQGNAKAARYYVLKILNEGLAVYRNSTDILTQIKNRAFLEKWVYVSRDLYGFGITDYVLECFGLPVNCPAQTAKPAAPKAVKPAKRDLPEPDVSAAPSAPDGGVDMEGLIDDAAKVQSWKEKVYSENKNATVEISGATSGGIASGTGFIISRNGYLITNDHVVFDDNSGVYYSKLTMSLIGESKKYKIEVLFSDAKADVALCKFNPEEVQEFKCVKRIADYSKVEQAQECLIIGNAFGMGLAPLTGEIRFAKNREGNLVHSAPSNPGDSGGPVFNRFGECIGINKSKTVSVNGTVADGYANATPMDKIEELLDKWTSKNNIEL